MFNTAEYRYWREHRGDFRIKKTEYKLISSLVTQARELLVNGVEDKIYPFKWIGVGLADKAGVRTVYKIKERFGLMNGKPKILSIDGVRWGGGIEPHTLETLSIPLPLKRWGRSVMAGIPEQEVVKIMGDLSKGKLITNEEVLDRFLNIESR